jgi:hypothetical protein
MTCFFVAWGALLAQAPQPGTVTVGFRNQTNRPIIVQGFTVVNGVQRRGQNLPINKNGKAFEVSVPAGTRYYTIYDANQPSRILLSQVPVPIQSRDVTFTIMTTATNPPRIVIVPSDGQ